VFLDRRRRHDPFLEWKVRIFSGAAAIALVGIALDQRWMTGTALGLLVGGVLLRFLPRPGVESEEDDDDPVGDERLSG
jgi:hypothetical protein